MVQKIHKPHFKGFLLKVKTQQNIGHTSRRSQASVLTAFKQKYNMSKTTQHSWSIWGNRYFHIQSFHLQILLAVLTH